MSDTTHPIVTIGIPTYNRADAFLGQALESAINQTYPNVEIIVSDNCSTDHTEQLVKSYSNPKIRYFKHSQNIGAIKNFNYCLSQAKGQYFLLLPDDDLIDTDLIEKCMQALGNETERGVIIAGSRLIDGNGSVISESPNRLKTNSSKAFFLGWFSSEVALYLCSTLYNTKRLQELGGFRSKTNLFLDVVATVQLAAMFGRVDVHDVKASFRRHDSNMGGHSDRVIAWSEDSLFLLNVMCGLLSTKDEKDNLRLAGLPFFTQKSYRLCSTIKSPVERIKAYRQVYKIFQYGYSPFRFWYNKYIIAYVKSAVSKANRWLSNRVN